jgi:hypothetical protein
LAILALQRAGFDGTVSYDSEGFRLLLGSAAEGTIRAFLGNAQRDYCMAPDDQHREAVLQHYASVWSGLSAVKPGSIPESLLPAVRARAYFALTRLREAIDDDAKTE